MANYLATDTDLTSVADAIRTKGGTSAQLAFPAGFVSAVEAIPTGGGGLSYDNAQLYEVTIASETNTFSIDVDFTYSPVFMQFIAENYPSGASGKIYAISTTVMYNTLTKTTSEVTSNVGGMVIIVKANNTLDYYNSACKAKFSPNKVTFTITRAVSGVDFVFAAGTKLKVLVVGTSDVR